MISTKLYKSGLAWLWITAIVLVVDRYSKMWVMQHLTYQEPLGILPFFNLTLAYNTGAAFSFLHTASGWQNGFFSGLAFIVSIVILGWLVKQSWHSYWVNTALCLILGGALGNAWDRMLYGYVVDFLSFHLGEWYFAIFNIADSAICVGAFMLFLHWARQNSRIR
ncbi:MAG: lipoprotein signal peptidase [Gammaproteobacteria bacterium]|nr:lipoprotein signal peptidase [Gammaproteobacteria bacterium]MCW5582664.1 lipoprotein signal peptidase [Gammaproteobacteria bacterium]